ncbi:uncharacterized protein LOC143353015 [Halictus rubicundus]|uniref:uncharacterized protein LOC143353015 n=1 Tax=Halictus rubicundus TaxID=77578 RepID=UPI004036FBDD
MASIVSRRAYTGPESQAATAPHRAGSNNGDATSRQRQTHQCVKTEGIDTAPATEALGTRRPVVLRFYRASCRKLRPACRIIASARPAMGQTANLHWTVKLLEPPRGR